MILHPDEMHDGFCCDQTGFSYRAAYLPPAHVQTVIGGAALPFLAEGVSTDPDLAGSALRLIAMCSAGNELFGYQDAPTVSVLGAYVIYLVVTLVMFFRSPAPPKTAHSSSVTTP